MDFLSKLLDYKTEEITERHIKGLQPFTTNEKFNPDHLTKISLVACNLGKWVLAM